MKTRKITDLRVKLRLVLFLTFVSIGSTLAGRTYFISPSGRDSNPGTLNSPWATWQYAANIAIAGDTVFAMGGIWYVTGTSAVATFRNSGTAADPICFFNYPGQYPVIDGRLRFNQDWNTGFNFLKINYVKFRGIEIRNFLQPRAGVQQAVGMGGTDCSNMEFENMKIHNIGGSAVRWFGAWKYPAVWAYPQEGFAASTWYQALADHGYYIPAQASIAGDTVRFINCDAYFCCDSVSKAVGPGGAADGYKFDNEIDAYVEFTSCRAWKCSDDGFDVSGTVKAVFRNCISFGNGLLAGGDGSGYKVAYPRAFVSTPIRYFYNCIAASNRDVGIPVIVDVDYPCTSTYMVNNLLYNNDRGINENYGSGRCLQQQPRTYRNNIVFASKEIYGYEAYSFRTGSLHSNNSWDSNVTVTAADFLSLDTAQLDAPRRADGSLPDFTFGKLAANSDLIDAGITTGMAYHGSAPDMGPFETSYGAPADPPEYVSSVVDEPAPAIIEMNYSLALSNVVPPASAFRVRVNSVYRTVNFVTVSGTKVLLTLSSGVGYGDIVTTSYTKPAVNPLQTTSGVEATSISNHPVDNYIDKSVVTGDQAETTGSGITIYPNPVRDVINISFDEPSEESYTLRILSLSGKAFFEDRLETGSTKVSIPVKLSPGLYFVQLLSNGITLPLRKIIVM
jgi:hypothetical protein